MKTLLYYKFYETTVIIYIVLFVAAFFIGYVIYNHFNNTAKKTVETVPSAYGLNIVSASAVEVMPKAQEVSVPAYTRKKWGTEISDEDFQKCLRHLDEINDEMNRSVEEALLRQVADCQTETVEEEVTVTASLESDAENVADEYELEVYPEAWESEENRMIEDEEDEDDYYDSFRDSRSSHSTESSDEVSLWNEEEDEYDDMLDIMAYFLL